LTRADACWGVESGRAIKVLFIEPWGERLGGAENFLWTFLRHVDRQHVTPSVVFLQPGPFEREVAALGLKTVVLPAGRLRQIHSLVRVVRQLARLLRADLPDLVINWSAKTQVYGALAAASAGIADRVIWWQQSVPNGHWLDRLATLLPARAIGCYSSLAQQAQQAHWPRRVTFVTHPGIDCPATLPKDDQMALRGRLGIPEHRFVMGIVGRLQPWKGQDRFLRALAGLRQRGHDVHGLVVGGDAGNFSPGYEGLLYELVRELGVERNVTFTGQVPEPGPYVQLMDVSVNASMGEPFGLVLLEAMALGVPVVAFAVGGPAEILDSGRAGVLVPAGYEASLVDGLERLVVDPGFRLQVARSGYQRYRDLFSAERMALELEHRLRDICAA
jgi:glycosyltransferase involved in cell wall biosynthesis